MNFGGLPGLAQLGSLVGIGVALSAFVMIFAFLPPLFPNRMQPQENRAVAETEIKSAAPLNPLRTKIVFAVTAILILFCAAILFSGLPKMDASADALQPRDSQAYATLDAIKTNLGQKREPLWLVISGRDENEVAQKLDAVSNRFWKMPFPTKRSPVFNRQMRFGRARIFKMQNRAVAQQLISERAAFHAAAADKWFCRKLARPDRRNSWQPGSAPP